MGNNPSGTLQKNNKNAPNSSKRRKRVTNKPPKKLKKKLKRAIKKFLKNLKIFKGKKIKKAKIITMYSSCLQEEGISFELSTLPHNPYEYGYKKSDPKEGHLVSILMRETVFYDVKKKEEKSHLRSSSYDSNSNGTKIDEVKIREKRSTLYNFSTGFGLFEEIEAEGVVMDKELGFVVIEMEEAANGVVGVEGEGDCGDSGDIGNIGGEKFGNYTGNERILEGNGGEILGGNGTDLEGLEMKEGSFKKKKSKKNLDGWVCV